MPSQPVPVPAAMPAFRAAGSTARIRPRLLLALLVALMPLLAYEITAAELARRARLDWLWSELRDAAAQAARQQGQALDQAGRLLRLLARAPLTGAVPGGLCAAAAGALGDGGADLAGVAVLGADGGTLCAAGLGGTAPGPGGGQVRAALEAPGTIVLSADPATGPVLTTALAPEEGRPGAVLALALAPARVPDLGLPLRREQAERLLVDIDGGTVLAAAPAGRRTPGAPVALPRLLAAVRDQAAGGVVVVRDRTGGQLVYGFARLGDPAAPEAGVAEGGPAAGGLLAGGALPAAGRLALLVSLPYDALLAEADARRHERWLAVALLVLLGVGAAWVVADRGVLRPVSGWIARRPGHALSREAALEAMRPAATWLRHQGDLAVVAEAAGEVVMRLGPDLRVAFVSPAALAVLGYRADEVVGAELGREPGWEACQAQLDRWRTTGEPQAASRIVARRKDGREVRLEVRASRLADGGFVLACRDIGAEHRLEQQVAEMGARLAELAREDRDSGLANRQRFDQALDQEVRRAQRVQEPLALVMVRFAGWEVFAGARGEGWAAEAARRVAVLLGAALRRPGDLAARFETAVFALLLPITDGIGAARVAERLHRSLAALAEDPDFAGITVEIGACSLLPLGQGDGPHSFLAAASAALAEARAAGGRRIGLVGTALPQGGLPLPVAGAAVAGGAVAGAAADGERVGG